MFFASQLDVKQEMKRQEASRSASMLLLSLVLFAGARMTPSERVRSNTVCFAADVTQPPSPPPTPSNPPQWSLLLSRRGSHPAQCQLRGCQKLCRGSRSAVCLPRPPHSPRFRSEAVTRCILLADGTGGRRIPGIAREARQEGFGFHQNIKETARESLPLAFFFLCLNDVSNL